MHVMLPQLLVQSQQILRMDQHKACSFSTSTSPIYSSLDYFVSHTAVDGLPAEDIKSIRHQNIYMIVDMYKMLKLVMQIQFFESFMSPRIVKGTYVFTTSKCLVIKTVAVSIETKLANIA